MTDEIRVLLVDDHAVMRAGFRMILEAESDIRVVGEAGTGVQALAEASALRPDVICMDVQMPDMDGLEATRRLVTAPEMEAAIVVVTTFDRDDYLFQALEAGASGFLLKNAGPEELVTAVRVAAAGDALLAPAVTRRVIERFTHPPQPVDTHSSPFVGQDFSSPSRAGSASFGADHTDSPASRTTGGRAPAATALLSPLTERESEVLRLLADARSNAEIAADLFIGEATVKTHVSNVLQKLGARDRVAAVVWAHRHGLA